MLIRTFVGDRVNLAIVATASTLDTLKDAIASHPAFDIPKHQQKLVYAGKTLEAASGKDDQDTTLAELGVEDDSIIHLCASS